jgi:CheY-like chemotaxis protein/anti-sigma regulatory factor (Ser/Thr protein kinase)
MKLARVLGNLLGNAIKFTESGGVCLQWRSLPDGSVQIQVADSGVGISPEHLEHIFDEFFQLRNPERDRTKGTGLGLAICKRLMDTIGCTLSVASTPGSGSTFTLCIPQHLVIDAPQQKTAPAPIAADDEPALANLRILLVEDHDTTRRTTAQLLAAEGAVVLQAETGRAAIHVLAHEPPHVVLLDLMLPDIDGREVLEHIQRHRPATLRKILAVSGDVTARRHEEVMRLGADALVPKPVRIEALIELLKPCSPRQFQLT